MPKCLFKLVQKHHTHGATCVHARIHNLYIMQNQGIKIAFFFFFTFIIASLMHRVNTNCKNTQQMPERTNTVLVSRVFHQMAGRAQTLSDPEAAHCFTSNHTSICREKYPGASHLPTSSQPPCQGEQSVPLPQCNAAHPCEDTVSRCREHMALSYKKKKNPPKK